MCEKQLSDAFSKENSKDWTDADADADADWNERQAHCKNFYLAKCQSPINNFLESSNYKSIENYFQEQLFHFG